MLKNGSEYEKRVFKDLILDESLLKDIEFVQCTFDKCSFAVSKFQNIVFERCKFTHCNLSNSEFPNSVFIDCSFEETKLLGIDWTKVKIGLGMVLKCVRCDFSYSFFASLNIAGSEFIGSKLVELDFSESNAKGVSFNGSNLSRSVFNRTNLTESDFRKATNYIFNPAENRIKKAKFSHSEVHNLIRAFGAEVEYD